MAANTADGWLANRPMRRCSATLIIREIQIKVAVRLPVHSCHSGYHQKPSSDKCRWGREEKGNFAHCRCEYKLVQPLWKTVWRFLKNPSNYTPGNTPLKYKHTRNFLGAKWVKTLHWHWSGFGHCGSADLIPGLGTSTCSGHCQNPHELEKIHALQRSQ